MTKILSIETISTDILSLFSHELKNILTSIADEYKIDKQVLFLKYLKTDSLNKLKKKKNKTHVDASKLCMARKQDGNQCTRRKKDDNNFCGKHIKNRKFGTIDDNSSIIQKFANDDNIIMTCVEIFNGIKYLVDDNNIVYTHNTSAPTIVGRKIGDGQIEFLPENLKNL